MKKVLLSARDPGAALNILSLFRLLDETEGFLPLLAASRPAIDIIRAYGYNPEPFIFESRKSDVFFEENDFSPLLSKADELLKRFSPDIVITGLSSFGAGIDEALILKSRVKTILYQDFWGDLNPIFNKFPDLVLCMDDLAADLTINKFGNISCEVIGFPKVKVFNKLDIKNIRKKTRDFINAGDNSTVISWFGQSPDIPGHNKILLKLIDKLSKINNHSIVFLLRGHPKFRNDINNIYYEATRAGLKPINISDYKDPLPWLISSDIVTTPFSTCGIDHVLLTSAASEPIGSMVYLLNNFEIQEAYFDLTGLNSIPLVEEGLGDVIYDLSGEYSIITDVDKSQYYKAAKKKVFFDEYKFLNLIA